MKLAALVQTLQTLITVHDSSSLEHELHGSPVSKCTAVGTAARVHHAATLGTRSTVRSLEVKSDKNDHPPPPRVSESTHTKANDIAWLSGRRSQSGTAKKMACPGTQMAHALRRSSQALSR